MFTPEASASPFTYFLLPAPSALLDVRRVLACAAVPVEAERQRGAGTLALVLGAVLAKVLFEGAPCAYALSSFHLSRRPRACTALGVAPASAAARGALFWGVQGTEVGKQSKAASSCSVSCIN